MVVHAFNLSTWLARAGGFLELEARQEWWDPVSKIYISRDIFMGLLFTFLLEKTCVIHAFLLLFYLHQETEKEIYLLKMVYPN